ncbi:linear amide C-N hydrolase [Methylocapsa acidiphila]|uniref:linear amide C-N hydrolase n=1 Tax=Methylocapsa acidiphila TaxID=133552 RepID=UPI00047AA262|nr:linear amide C-N hydrolase [Methylocapsa acidiphila]
MTSRLGKALFLLVSALALPSLLDHAARACSRVAWKTDSQGVFAGRSMDWDELIDPKLAIYPRGLAMEGGVDRPVKWSSRFGSLIVLGVNYGDAALDGMNEKGLTGHVLYLQATQYETRDQRPGVSYTMMLRYLLDNSATVAEALKALEAVQVVPIPLHGKLLGTHIALEDPSGDSAIIEFVKGKLVVHHGPQYQVMTNDPPYELAMKKLKQYETFGGKKPIPGNIESIQRFVRAQYFLKYLPQPKDPEQGAAFMFQIIHNVAVPFGAPYDGGLGGTYPTWWISAADLTNEVYYFGLTQNPNVIWADLKSLDFSSGRPVLVLDPKNPALVGNVGRGFQPEAGKQPH